MVEGDSTVVRNKNKESNMRTKPEVRTDDWRLTMNHNQTLSYEQKDDVNQTPSTEIEEAELEIIAAALRVRSGLQAGLMPCI